MPLVGSLEYIAGEDVPDDGFEEDAREVLEARRGRSAVWMRTHLCVDARRYVPMSASGSVFGVLEKVKMPQKSS